MGPSQSGTTTTVQNSSPWGGEQGFLTGSNNYGWAPTLNGDASSNGTSGVYGSAQALYGDTSAWPQYYPSSTYAPLTGQQQGIMSQLIGYGTQGGNSGLIGANNVASGANSPSYVAPTNATMAQVNPTIGSLGSGSAMSASNPTFNQSQGFLSNQMTNASENPFDTPGFQNLVNSTLANVIPATSASFINGGRADSGLATAAQTAAATNAVGGLASNYSLQEQALGQQAANTAAQNYGTGLNATLGAAGLAEQNFQAQEGNQLKAAGLSPLIDAQQVSDLGTALSTAGMTQTNNQNQINANVGAWNYNQNLPFNMLSQYENYITGAGVPASTSTTQPYYTNPTANIMSGVTGGIGGVAGLAYLASLIPMSDRKLKTDIHRIGTSESGFPLYLFRYKWEPKGTTRIGLMAQDVQKTMPEAVFQTPIGLAVDYNRALAVAA